MYRSIALFSLITFLSACGGTTRSRNKDGGGGGGDGGTMDIPGCDLSKSGPDSDQDQDGYTVAQGDCDDCNPSINPGAVQLPGDPTDYACNGMPGQPATCSPTTGATDPSSLAQAFEQCDQRFFKSATMVGPSVTQARAVKSKLGSITPQAGSTMAMLSTGLAADESDAGFVAPQAGTAFACSNEFQHPLPNIAPNPLCASVLGSMSCEPMMVKDYSELVLKLKAPTNVKSFTFNFQFLSAEYPDFVCTIFNDEFLVLMESQGEFQTPSNISFDSNKNPITVNNGLFTVCNNGTMTYDKNCKQPVSMLAGTGYELPISMASPAPTPQGADPLLGYCSDDYMSTCTMDPNNPGGDMTMDMTTPIGGSTGWLTTTAPCTPGEDITLHFIIFDEGDHIFDSAVLIDNFQWGTAVVGSPSTGPIM